MLREALVGKVINDYTLKKLIGGGAMGAVYAAEHPRAPYPLALKVLSALDEEDDRLVNRFKREAHMLKSLSHPNIVPLLGYGEFSGLRYLVMPLIQGLSLSDLLKKRRFSPLAVRNIFAPLSDALHYAHQKGIIHRDIKPGNVMIEARKDDMMHVYLMDFGLGKRIESESVTNLTASNLLLGTPSYMAPEQVLGAMIDHRADIYSLAVMIYQMLLGRLPFQHENIQMVALQHVEAAPPPPRSINPKFPKRLEPVLLQALAKHPEERYDSAEAFYQAYADAIQKLSDGERKAMYSPESSS